MTPECTGLYWGTPDHKVDSKFFLVIQQALVLRLNMIEVVDGLVAAKEHVLETQDVRPREEMWERRVPALVAVILRSKVRFQSMLYPTAGLLQCSVLRCPPNTHSAPAKMPQWLGRHTFLLHGGSSRGTSRQPANTVAPCVGRECTRMKIRLCRMDSGRA